MPTYAYLCPKCGHEFDKFYKMSAKVRPKCPACGTVAERQISGGAGLVFKGSGFYITDYAKSGKPDGKSEAGSPKAESKGGEASSKGEKKSEGSSKPSEKTKTGEGS